MNDDELIQREIDGVATPDESARLAALAAERPEAAARLESLRRAARDLERAERFEPPPRLLDDVMRAVRTTRAAAPKFFAALRDVLRGMLQPHTAMALAGTFVIGLGVGALLLRAPGLSSPSEKARVAGTSLPGDRLARPQPLSADGAQGEAILRSEKGLWILELRLDATRPVPVRVEGASPRGFTEDGPTARDVELEERQARFTHEAGRGRYTLTFEAPRGGELSVTLGTSGAAVALSPAGGA